MPQNENIERKEDEQISRIKKPQQVGWWLVSLLVIIGVVFLTVIARRYRELKDFPAWISFLTSAVLNLLLLTVIVVQAYIYGRQWKAMKEQLNAMRDQADSMRDSLTLTRQLIEQNERTIQIGDISAKAAETSAKIVSAIERPEIHIKGAQCMMAVEQQPYVTLNVTNSGRTTAYDVEVTVIGVYVDAISSEVLPFDEAPPETFDFMPPGNAITVHTGLGGALTQDDYDAIRAGSLLLIIYGTLSYRDSFGKRDERSYCRMYDRLTAPELAHCPKAIRARQQTRTEATSNNPA